MKRMIKISSMHASMNGCFTSMRIDMAEMTSSIQNPKPAKI